MDLLKGLPDGPERCFLIVTHRPLVVTAARTEQSGASRGLDVKRELKLLVPGASPAEEV